jgi:1,4-alpha-glucan branching enzyme
MREQLKITQNDPYLAPFESAIVGRHKYAIAREKELLGNSNNSLSEFAPGYLFFGYLK